MENVPLQISRYKDKAQIKGYDGLFAPCGKRKARTGLREGMHLALATIS